MQLTDHTRVSPAILQALPAMARATRFAALAKGRHRPAAPRNRLRRPFAAPPAAWRPASRL